MPTIFDDPNLIESFYTGEPGAALYSLFPQAAGTSQLSSFLRNRLSPLYTQYQSILPQDPNLTFRSFLSGQDLLGQFNALAPQQRGIDFGRFQPRLAYRGRFGGI